MHDPATVEVARRNMPVELIAQVVHPVDKDRKRELLAHLVKSNNWHQVLVFAKTKHGANRLAEQLSRDGIEADAIHGNKSQPQRMRALKRFKDNELQVLVATDIASRGIDIESLPHVVNYDLPNVSEDYVHRIGRTGRAGESGEAVTLLSGEERTLLSAIERLIGRKIEQKVVAGFEPSNAYHSAKPEPQQRRGQQPRNEPRRHEQKRAEQQRRPDRSRGPQPAAQASRGKPSRRKQNGTPGQRQDERWSDQDQQAIREQQRMHHQRQQAAGSPTQKAPALLGNFGRKAA
jgi:ATP-dependent RNA helicase RhlE